MDVLVLNMDYSPINVTSLKKGFKLVYMGKAEIIKFTGDSPIKTEKRLFKRPTVIRLLNYIVLPFRKVKLNRENILRRDGYKCVYCGSNDRMTIDHVIPKYKGGNNNWDNLVACCDSCNVKKDHKNVDVFLKEYGLIMSHQPFKPSYLYFVQKMNEKKDDWLDYIKIN